MREMKDSGVEWIGEIPKDWHIMRFRFFIENYKAGPFGSSLKLDGLLSDGDILIYTPEHIANNSTESEKNLYLPNDREEEMSQFLVDDGDILFPIVGTLGRAMIVDTAMPKGIINQRVAKFRLNNNIVYTRYFMWLFAKSDFYETYIDLSSRGSFIVNLTKGIINDMPCVVPNIDIQKRIADYLDEKCSKIDAVIEKQQEIIEKLKEYKLSVINEKTKVNTGVRCHLSYLGQMKNGLNFSDIDDGVKIMFLGVGDFKDYYVLDNETMFSTVTVNEEDLSDELMLESGDIIFVRSNGSKELVGRAVMVDDIDFKLTYTGFAIRYRNIRKDVINNKYLLYYFRSPDFRKLLEKNSQGSNISNLSQDLLGNIEINIPNMDYQNRAVSYLDEKCKLIDKTIEDRQRAIAKLQEYKKSLIYEVVTGKREV